MTIINGNSGARSNFDGLRIVHILLLVLVLGWAYLQIAGTLSTQGIEPLRQKLARGELVPHDDAFAMIDQVEHSPANAISCFPGKAQKSAALSLEMIQNPAVTGTEQLRWSAEARRQISSAISCRRNDGNLWLLMAQLEMLSASIDQAFIAISRSSELAPYEGFVVVRRLLLLAAINTPPPVEMHAAIQQDLKTLKNIRPYLKNPLLEALGFKRSAAVGRWFSEERGIPVAE